MGGAAAAGGESPRSLRPAPNDDRAAHAASDSFDLGSTEQALRHNEQHSEDNQEGDGILIIRRDVACAERLQQTKKEAPDHRAEGAAYAAEHCARKSLKRQQRSDIIAGQRDRSDEDSCDRPNRRRYDEREVDDAPGIDPDEARRKPVGGSGDDRLAEQGTINHPPKQCYDDSRTSKHDEALWQDGGATEADRVGAEQRR